MASVVFLLMGIFFFFHPTFLSGFSQIQTDPGDTRLNNFILEHSYQWLIQNPLHKEFWSPPFFYPEPNVAGFTEILAGVAPFYWILRALTIAPDTAFQLWMVLIAALNFLFALYLFRKTLRLHVFPSNMAAFLIAFGAPRLAQLSHHQLLPHFYAIGALICLISLFYKNTNKRAHAIGVVAFLTAQFYSGIYVTWFLGFCLTWILVAALLHPKTRPTLFSTIRPLIPTLLVSTVVSVALIYPMAQHYLRASEQIGYWGYADAFWLLPTWQSWLYLGPDSWLYPWQEFIKIFRMIPNPHEQRIGLGLVTTVLVFLGFYPFRKNPWVQVIAIGFGFIFLVVTLFPLGITAWKFFYETYPGANAIRGLCRIGLTFLIPAGLGVALFFQKKPRFALLGLLVLLEQGQTTPSYNKHAARENIENLAETIRASCQAHHEGFFFSPKVSTPIPAYSLNLDAMWATQDSQLPTVNGYTSKPPKPWKLDPAFIETENDTLRIQEALSSWIQVKGLDERSICWIRSNRFQNLYSNDE